MTRRATRPAAVAVVVVVLLGLAGCGVGSQPQAERISADDVPFGLVTDGPTPTSPPLDPDHVHVFLVRGGQLAPVVRSVASADPASALASLLEGPTADESTSGYTSAVPAGVRVTRVNVRDGTAVVDLTGEFLKANVGDSALGLAQMVDTLAQFPSITTVRFQLDGRTVGVPRGDGSVTKAPVSPSDYPAPGA